jgi:hypothetical protein
MRNTSLIICRDPSSDPTTVFSSANGKGPISALTPMTTTPPGFVASIACLTTSFDGANTSVASTPPLARSALPASPRDASMVRDAPSSSDSSNRCALRVTARVSAPVSFANCNAT